MNFKRKMKKWISLDQILLNCNKDIINKLHKSSMN